MDEPDLAEIKTDVPRAAAEKVLGKPLWHVGVFDGLRYEIYQYQTEKPSRPIIGVIALGFDVISFGSLSLMDNPRNLEKAKQVAVAYNNQDQVVFVSRPWSISQLGPCRRQRYLIPEDVAVPTKTRPNPLEDQSKAALNTAILEDEDLEIDQIDGHTPEEDVIELQPGLHTVLHHGILSTVEFFPGRRYRMEHESIYGYARYRRFYFIEDVESAETLCCKEPTQNVDHYLTP